MSLLKSPIANFSIIWLVAIVIVFIIAVGISFAIGYIMRKKTAESVIGSAEKEAESIIFEAKKNAEARKKEILVEAKEESIKIKNELEKEVRDRKNELSRQEKRLQQKEENLDKKSDSLDKRGDLLTKRIENADKKLKTADELLSSRQSELERISGLTTEEARSLILASLEEDLKHEKAVLIKEYDTEIKQDCEKKAREIIVSAIQRCAVDHVAENTVSVVTLPNDEMKGRIIGREGRNIRTLEFLTGIEFIIDDTPEAIILSGFDAMRREIARIALERLIVDGRVHPAKIEEMVEKAKKEVEQNIKEEGEAVTFEIGVYNLHPELVRLLGKLKFRTSYGQNVLKHSVEVAHLCGIMASELGLDPTLAKRAGLLHDIGKAIDHDVDGSHIELGVALCRKYRESPIITNAVEAHHGDVEPESIVAVLVQAADTISAARPGARRETLESYIKRLESLENIAASFDGVEHAFAIQAGRELRIMIIPETVDDDGMKIMAREIAEKIHNELKYPGKIKVNLIRETRAVDYA